MKVKTLYCLFAFSLLILLNSCIQYRILPEQSGLVDITDNQIEITPEYAENLFDGDENILKLCDNNFQTKYLTKNNSCWIIFKSSKLSIVTGYSITSGNDAPQRDPQEWTLEGSLNGINYQTLDVREHENWLTRNEKRDFNFSNSQKYRYYRLNLKNHGFDVYGMDYLQLSEVEIFGVFQDDIIPVADFTADTTNILVGEEVTFTNLSQNYADCDWVFEGGKVVVENAQTVVVQYDTAGIYKVSLSVKDDHSNSDHVNQLDYIIVKKDNSDWGNFIAPKISFTDEDQNSKGSMIYHKLVGDPDEYISVVGEYVCRHLFNNSDKITVPIRILNYKLRSGMEAGIPSYLSGSGAVTSIDFSSDHVAAILEKTGSEILVEAEIYGVLFHEMTHGYQLKAEGCGEYDGSSENWAFVEGMADAVRIRAGFHQNSKPYATERKWLEGYTVTGYFYNWLANNKDEKFLIKLNLSTRSIKPWSFAAACQKILGESADSLWQEYITALTEGSKPTADFQADRTKILVGDSVRFLNATTDGITYDWTFEGGEPSKSYDDNVIVKYLKPGLYNVTLVAHNRCALGPGINVKQKFIEVE